MNTNTNNRKASRSMSEIVSTHYGVIDETNDIEFIQLSQSPNRLYFDAYPSLTEVDLLIPTVEMIKTNDIINSLANICRFGGHCNGTYTVAQHSVLVAMLVPDEMMREALMHDATETYVGDVIKPFKNVLGEVFEQIENNFLQLIIEKYNLDPLNLIAVKHYDKLVYEAERDMLRFNDPERFNQLCEIAELPAHVWSHDEARTRFANLYHKLFKTTFANEQD